MPVPYNERKKLVFSTDDANKLNFHIENKLDPNLTPYIKTNSKWIKDLNLRAIKLYKTQESIFMTLNWAMD